ncbi:hypothetical protein LVISKB_1166 [Levilactobacillus brevis KB290]|uniref:Uncharacterized protein n=1 Tax=Levilactobacillus brevis KB290 TaxID=1001583 RepID=M5B032_LEVBR|nr:hypothetical protein LVISKB_1166 [Levilactobacillus brevis KB290]
MTLILSTRSAFKWTGHHNASAQHASLMADLS